VDPRNAGRYLLGIECDGATYHSAKTARDRDRLRQEVLEALGWRIHRIWSTEWLRSTDKELNRLVSRIQSEIATPISPRRLPKPESAEIVRSNNAPSPDRPTQLAEASPSKRALVAHPYVETELSVPTNFDLLSASPKYLVPAVIQCVEKESPIHQDLVIIRISRHWGNARTGNRIREQLERAIRRAIDGGTVSRRGEFLWKPGRQVPDVRGRTRSGEVRSITHIAPEEIMEAFQMVLKSSLSLAQEELIRETARLFGYDRTGRDILESLSKVLANAVKTGVIENQAGRFRLSRRSSQTP